jgi:hypothetical protein
MSDKIHATAVLLPGVRAPGTHWIRGWVGPRADLDVVAKRKIPITFPTGKWTLVIQLVA